MIPQKNSHKTRNTSSRGFKRRQKQNLWSNIFEIDVQSATTIFWKLKSIFFFFNNSAYFY